MSDEHIPAATPESRGKVGELTAIVSGYDDGPICGWSFDVGDGRLIYAGEISNHNFSELDEDACEAFGGKPFGWFLMCFWHDRQEVWAKCAGEDEARRLVTLIGSMLYAGFLWRQEDHAKARQLVEHATAS
jgi:hypothetical protein